MGGGDLNLKKSWHPQTMKNQERVWKAEQADAAEKRKMWELQQEIASERSREELKRIGQSSGVLKANDDKKLEWMYKAGELNREDYLTGRAIDKNFEQQDAVERQSEKGMIGVTQSINHVEHECIPFSIRAFRGSEATTEQVDIQRKIMEDPLMAIKQREMETRKKLLQNPVKLKEIHRMLQEDKQLHSSSDRRKDSKKSKKKKKKRSKSESSEGSDADLDSLLARKYRKIQGDLNDKDEKDFGLDNLLKQKYDKLTSELDKMRKSTKKKSRKKNSPENDGYSLSDNGNKKRRKVETETKGHNPFRREPKQDSPARYFKQRSPIRQRSRSNEHRNLSPRNDDTRRQRRPSSRERTGRHSWQESHSNDRKDRGRNGNSRSRDRRLDHVNDSSIDRHRTKPLNDRNDRHIRSRSKERNRVEDRRGKSPTIENNRHSKRMEARQSIERRRTFKSPNDPRDQPRHDRKKTPPLESRRDRSRSGQNSSRRVASADRRKPSVDRTQTNERHRITSTNQSSRHRSRSRSRSREKPFQDQLSKPIKNRYRQNTPPSATSRLIQGPQQPPKRSSSSESNSSRSSKSSSSSTSSNDSHRQAASARNYGLITASGQKIELKNRSDDKIHKSRTPPKATSSHKVAPYVRPARERMSDEDKARRLREMQQNADWREKEREVNVKRSREEAKREAEQEKNSTFDRDYINKQMHKALSNHSSVEARIKSNLNNIQRTGHSMNQSFIRK